ncbi:MAG: formate dehydrogenase family accessory protein FdhD [Dehalococcoidia bacterium]|nr:formate dehydrogenase family accessory protein FdhD [Dehalococcoidia bacterium]
MLTKDEDGVQSVTYSRYKDGEWSSISTPVPRELPLAVYVNERELVTILCTPVKLNFLIVGYLYVEGIISHPGEITSMRVCIEDSLADVRLSKSHLALPERRVLTTGCGGGVASLADTKEIAPVESRLTVAPGQILSLMKRMQEQATLFELSGGMHTSALADEGNVLVIAEDVGRHNTLDKILGECLLRNIPTEEHLLVTTGRLSSEMVIKAARMRVPIVVSRSSPTSSAIALAQRFGITVVGYARGSRLSVYTVEDRIGRDGS